MNKTHTQLIAAAHDMLKALKWAERCLTDDFINPEVNTDLDAAADCVKAIRSAIAKAVEVTE